MKNYINYLFNISGLSLGSFLAPSYGSLLYNSLLKDPTLNRKWTIYLIHHTHLDIGFTHTQEEVLHRQWEHLSKAMDLIECTANNQPGERFVWNPEGMWAVDKWFKQASESERQRFIKHVRNGSIGLSGLYGSLHTYYSRPAEMMAMCGSAREIEDLSGIKARNAMITDVPGWSWGLVETMAKNGIQYFSAGPNEFDRTGNLIKVRGDKPFWWVSPSGKEKVLVFVHGKGYSWAHEPYSWAYEDENQKFKKPDAYPFPTRHIKDNNSSKWLLSYLKKLEGSSAYPYDILPLRYNVGADNGPPDQFICERIKRWNSEHENIQIKLATVDQAMDDFVQKYGDKIPEYQGDFSGYWEDGAMSAARETGLARASGENIERLLQTNILSDYSKAELDKSDDAWKEVLLYNEHTFGALTSIWEPDAEFTKSQWEWKKQRAVDSASICSELLDMRKKTLGGSNESKTISVFNPHSWDISNVVYIPAAVAGDAVGVEDENGSPLISQKLVDGRLAFYADLNALKVSRFKLSDKSGVVHQKIAVDEKTLSNGILDVKLDSESGCVTSVRNKENGLEYINQMDTDLFNQYLYIKGVHGKFGQKKNGENIVCKVVENGPVVAIVRVISSPPGTKSLISEYSLEINADYLKIRNILNRPPIPRSTLKPKGMFGQYLLGSYYKKEAILFSFPFNMEESKLYYDIPFGRVDAEEQLLDGGCRNYLTACRYLELNSESAKVTAVLMDAPMFQPFDIYTDVKIRPYAEHFKPNNGKIYSYVMNNYWHTNFKFDQPGITEFKYVFKFSGNTGAADSSRLSASQMQQPIIFEGNILNRENSLGSFAKACMNHPKVKIQYLPEGKSLGLYAINETPDPVLIDGTKLSPFEFYKIE